jgi:hypothetical protein
MPEFRRQSAVLAHIQAHSGVARVAMTGSEMPDSVPVIDFKWDFSREANSGDNAPHKGTSTVRPRWGGAAAKPQ